MFIVVVFFIELLDIEFFFYILEVIEFRIGNIN